MANVEKVTELFQKLSTGDAASVAELANVAKAGGAPALASAGIVEKLKAALEDASAPARETALQVGVAVVWPGRGRGSHWTRFGGGVPQLPCIM